MGGALLNRVESRVELIWHISIGSIIYIVANRGYPIKDRVLMMGHQDYSE